MAGENLATLDEDDLARFRGNHVGIVFQAFHLIPTMTAIENVAVPRELAGAADAFDRAREELAAVGLDHRLGHYPGELSGGEQQRVAIARALVNRPDILLADEPTGNLDAATGDQVMRHLFARCRDQGTTLLLITHEARLAALCGRTIRMADGRIEAARPAGSEGQEGAESSGGRGRDRDRRRARIRGRRDAVPPSRPIGRAGRAHRLRPSPCPRPPPGRLPVAPMAPVALRFAARELRQGVRGLRGFGVFLGCLALGVAAIAGVQSTASSIVTGLRADGREVLGGDLALRAIYRELDAEERADVDRMAAEVSHFAEMRTMARRPGREAEASVLVELKAVDGRYPLFGTFEARRGDGAAISMPRALERTGGGWGALVDPALIDRLELRKEIH